MEDEICQFQKFGYCKFEEKCKRKHLKEVCDSLSRCQNKKECQKRHPKRCRRFDSESSCRFQEKCAYDHQACEIDEEKKELKEKVKHLEEKVVQLAKKVENGKVEQMEPVVKALTRKVLSLENEILEIKKNKSREVLNDKENKTEKGIHKDNCLSNTISFDSKDIEDNSSTPKATKEKNIKVLKKDELLTCFKCEYKCKKPSTLEKHRLAKHEEHVCKECEKKFSSFMELLKHVANQHHKDEGEVEDEILEEGATIPNEIKNIDKNLAEEKLEEDDQLDDLEAELNSLKTELKLK